MTILRAADRATVSWRNGRGLTKEVTAGSGWRISIAAIERDAPFSRFDGYDRALFLLDGGPLLLTAPGWRRRLVSGEAVMFAGEDAIHAAVEAPARALNLMTARGTLAGLGPPALTPLTIAPKTIAIVLDGMPTLDRETLRHLDAVAGPARIEGSGLLLPIRLPAQSL